MKFHIPFFNFKAAAEASCALAAAMLSIQAFASVNPAVQEYARRAAAEGIVLLKNDNNALPFGQNGAQPVAFFGITQVQTFLVGYGSGGDVKPPYRVTLTDVLAKTDKIVPDKACDWSGPVDLTAMDCGEGMKMGENSPEDVLLDSKLSKEPDKYKSLSATYYVDKKNPPIIIFHGEKDNVVPCCQGKMFFEKLQDAGVKTEATFVPEGGHGMGMYSEENLQKMVRFLDAARTKK